MGIAPVDGSMRLSNLIEGITINSVSGPLNEEVLGIAYHSKQVQPNGVFVAMRGSHHNGHDFIAQAIRNGAKAVIAEEIPEQVNGVTMIQVPNSRRALARVSATFYGDPSLKLKVIGITGTNGKTTTSYLLESMVHQAGYAPGVVGTINCRFGGQSEKISNTTPESLELQILLSQMAKQEISHAIMEVSSHALDQNRVAGVHFDVGVFTNLTSEHLDYHGTMENYAQSKAKLFSQFLEESEVSGEKFAVVNQDDPQGDYLCSLTSARAVRYGMMPNAEVTIEDATISPEGMRGVLKTFRGDITFSTPLLGRFNLYNIMAATGAALCLDVPPEVIRSGLEKVVAVPGRMERVGKEADFTVLVDYAHTPDALEQVLSSLKELSPSRIIVVFGCGGDRDRSKRPIMGRIAALLSEVVIITSDNPRTEKPEQIIAEVEAGVKDAGLRTISPSTGNQEIFYHTVADRREAIHVAIRMAQRGDVVLVAGKGHEDYQILKARTIVFDDRTQIEEALQERSTR